jgi:hypothetical protein
MKLLRTFIFIYILINAIRIESAELLCRTDGYLNFGKYVSGVPYERQSYPAYHSDFFARVNILKLGTTSISSDIGSTSLMSIQHVFGFTIDYIRCDFSLNARREFNGWLINGAFSHGSLHKVSAPEAGKPILFNSYQLGIGTRDAYNLAPSAESLQAANKFLNTVDGQVNIGIFNKPKNSVFSGLNHQFKSELFSLVRYNVGTYRKWASAVGLNQHSWFLADSPAEHKISVSLNLYCRGTASFLGLYYSYTLYDTSILDNTHKMGLIGIQAIF